VARGGAEAVAGEAAETLRRRGLDVGVVRTHAPGACISAARDTVQRGNVDLVVAVGGDGTAREVAQGMAEALGTWPDGGPAPTDAPRLLILPAGTGNSMHKALWDDRSWQDTLAAALDATAVRRDLDLARITGHDRAVLLGASAGFLRWTVETTARFPDLSGRELYATAGLTAAQELEPFAGRVSVDGRLLAEGPMVLAAVGGAQRRGGSLLLFPHSLLDDGRLDVCVLQADGPDDAIPLLMAAMEGAHLTHPGVHYAHHAREVSLECLDGPLPFEHDGDLWHDGTEPSLHLSVVPHAVPVVAPPSAQPGGEHVEQPPHL
jgi:diacylglycerol kinase (ATP)